MIWIPQLRSLGRVVPRRAAGSIQGPTIPVDDEETRDPRGPPSLHSWQAGGGHPISWEKSGPTFGRQVTLGLRAAGHLGYLDATTPAPAVGVGVSSVVF